MFDPASQAYRFTVLSFASLLMYAGLGVVGLVFAVLLKRSDRDVGGVLVRAPP